MTTTASPSPTTPPPFDLLGPLPEGTTVLEASAGTGKTFTIAALVARYIAEGVADMEQMLVVSFSRESTRELRERVRERLVSARDGLLRPTLDAPLAPPGDRLLAHLAAADPAEVSVRRRRLEDALAVFDAATVTTTHGFCQQVLLTLGTAGDYDSGAVLVENISDLVTEVADDLFLRKWGGPGAEQPQLSRAEFRALALAAATDPATTLLPDPTVGGAPGMRARICAAVRLEVDRRKRRRQVVDYDDMLLRLAATLTDPDVGPVARARLRARYRIVLVDEFQDTDPVQWSILREAFHGHRTLVLIGDPKQAIYGFRGADVHAYLEARASATVVSTLPTNWRSDALLLDGLGSVLHGAALGDPRIRVLPVQAEHTGRMVDSVAPVRLRVLPRSSVAQTKGGVARTSDAREAVARDLAAEVVDLLSATTPSVRPRDGGPSRPLEPGDIAVLVRTNTNALLVQECLAAAGVPVVLTGRTSVFTTPAAQEWQLLLEALEQPHRTTRVRRLALGCFVGLDAAELGREPTRGDAHADALALRLRWWGRVLEDRGVAALFEAVSLSEDVQPRILARQGGERLLTDLRHIAQVLHEASLDGGLGLTALLVWLRRRRDEALRETGQERSRLLETDAAAVQVITVHTSKGLEFPVVLVPFAWDLFSRPDPLTAVFHDEADRRVRDVGGSGSPDWAAHIARHRQEEVNDELRLVYVAMTRAQSSLLLWWAPAFNTPKAPLHRLLFHDDGSTVAPLSIGVPDDPTALRAFQRRASGTNGGLAVEVIAPRDRAVWSPKPLPAPVLAMASFDRPLDTTWRRTSYSALTSAAHEQGMRFGSEPEVELRDDESEHSAPATDSPADHEALRTVLSAWDALPGGAAFGTLVHTVLEELPDHPDPTAVRTLVAAKVERHGPPADVDVLTAGLVQALATPLGELAPGVALRDVAAADRLSELDFELPIVGGDDPGATRVQLGDLVPLWREHCPTGRLAGYADALDGLAPAALRGYLAGSIDAVLRVGDAQHRRYVVVDYKTNRLGRRDEPLTAWHYRPAALERAMVDAHYPLQALLYGVALHRFLRWRQPGYDPAVHLGGVLYLFLRGMSGPDLHGDGVSGADGSPPGVFAWRPPAALVTATSDLLAGRTGAAP